MSSFTDQTFHVQISVDRLIGKSLRFCQDRTIFCDQMMSSKDQIRRRFSFSCAGIDISAYQAAGLKFHQISSIGVFSSDFITG